MMNKENNQVAVVSNDLVLRSRYRLNLLEQKIVLYMASRIKPDDKDFHRQIVPLTELVDAVRSDDDKKWGSAYEKIDKVIDGFFGKKILIDTGIVMPKSKSKQTLKDKIAWVQAAKYRNINGQICVEFCFAEDLKPFLLELKRNFTKYHLREMVRLRSPNSLRLYQILKAHKDKKQKKSNIAKCLYSVIELKERLGLQDAYEKYNHFKSRVLLTAQKQLKENTSIAFEFEEKKQGRKVTSFVFTIYTNEVKLTKDNPPNLLDLMVGEVADSESASILFAAVRKWGISQKKVNELVKQYPQQYLEEKRIYTNQKIKENKVKDPASYFIKALIEDYKDQNKDKQKQQKVAKKEREARVLAEELKKHKITQLKQAHYENKKVTATNFFTKNPQVLDDIFTAKRKKGSLTLGRNYDDTLSPFENYSQNPMLAGLVLTELEERRKDLFVEINSKLAKSLAKLN